MFYKVVLNKNNCSCEVHAVMADTKEEAVDKAKYRLAQVTSENMYNVNEIEEIVRNLSVISCELR